jgi:hypothetical protein
MTGRVLLLPGEEQSALDALVAQWQEEYPTDTVEAAKLVQEAAHSEWILLRVQRQSDKTFGDLFQKGMDAWEDGEHKRYQLTQRYLTAAERKVERNRRLIWQYRRELRSQARELREAERFAGRQRDTKEEPASESSPEPSPEPKRKCDTPMKQQAIVSVKNGQTVTFFSPPHENILRANGLREQDTLVERQIEFECDEIPAEYAWCADEIGELEASPSRPCILVFHTLRTFTIAVEREAANGGHVQSWPELFEEDKHFIEEALDKK